MRYVLRDINGDPIATGTHKEVLALYEQLKPQKTFITQEVEDVQHGD